MKLNPDGTCPACIGGWLCKFHQQEGLRIDAQRSQVIKQAVAGIRRAEIARTCARYELESDEMLTAEQKAVAILNQTTP